jgi:hypothetical protein
MSDTRRKERAKNTHRPRGGLGVCVCRAHSKIFPVEELKNSSMPRISRQTLTTAHTVAALLHAAQAAVTAALITEQPGGDWRLTIGSQTVQYKLAYLLPLFPMLSVINHASASIGDGWYSGVIENQVNPVRWIEYSISAGVMLWIIATLAGVTNVETLLSLAILNAALQYVGYLIEHAMAQGQTAEARALLLVAFTIHVSIWIQLMLSFYLVLASYSNARIPAVVYAIMPIMFGLFTVFGLWATLWVEGVVSDFTTLEMGYIILSFISKTLLTWMVFFGVVREQTTTATTTSAPPVGPAIVSAASATQRASPADAVLETR